MLENWIETHSGKKMYFLEPTSEMIDINDIAHSLSMQCRFSGHTSRFYSVAEHSVRVAQVLLPRFGPVKAFNGLLHDASEAYLLDIPSPVKQCLSNYKDIESDLMVKIMLTFGSTWPLCKEVKEADSVLLKNEARNLLPSKGESWINKYPTSYELNDPPFCLNPEGAESVFILWFNLLRKDIEDGARSKENVQRGTGEVYPRQPRSIESVGVGSKILCFNANH